MGWSYYLGKINNRFYLCEVVISDDYNKCEYGIWGYRISWLELFKHPIMVISDLIFQYRNVKCLLNIELLEQNMKLYFDNKTKHL